MRTGFVEYSIIAILHLGYNRELSTQGSYSLKKVVLRSRFRVWIGYRFCQFNLRSVRKQATVFIMSKIHFLDLDDETALKIVRYMSKTNGRQRYVSCHLESAFCLILLFLHQIKKGRWLVLIYPITNF